MPPAPYQQHTAAAADIVAGCAVVTLSDTRTAETDVSGQRAMELIAGSHRVVAYQVVKDDPAALGPVLVALLARSDVDVILTTGGTGIGRRDQTIGVVERLLDVPLPGFGELFRMLSWEQIGSGAMLSRAVAGVVGTKLVFSMPGSPKAVELALARLVLPELRHLLRELRK